MDISLQGASQVNLGRQELPPNPPQAEDVQEFQKLYWGDRPDQTALDPMLKMALNYEIEPISPSAFSKIMEKMMENTNKFEDMKESIFERLRNGGTVSLEERQDFMIMFQETQLQMTLFQSFTKKSEEGLKTLITGQ